MLIAAAKITFGDGHMEASRLVLQSNADDTLLSVVLAGVDTVEIPDYRCFHEHVEAGGNCTFFFVHQSRDIPGMRKTVSEAT